MDVFTLDQTLNVFILDVNLNVFILDVNLNVFSEDLNAFILNLSECVYIGFESEFVHTGSICIHTECESDYSGSKCVYTGSESEWVYTGLECVYGYTRSKSECVDVMGCELSVFKCFVYRCGFPGNEMSSAPSLLHLSSIVNSISQEEKTQLNPEASEH